MLFKWEAGWTQDVEAIMQELQQVWGILRGEACRLQMTVSTDSLARVRPGQEVFHKNKSLVQKVAKLQETVTDNQAALKVVEDKLANVKDSIEASEEFTTKLEESEKLLEDPQAEVGSLKDEVAHADKEKVKSNRIIAKAREESEHRLLRLNVTLASRILAENLTISLVTEFVNAVDAMF